MKEYQHYKGGVYKFICVATHTETNEKFVIYQTSDGGIFARPYEMFFENVVLNDGSIVPRFKEIKD